MTAENQEFDRIMNKEFSEKPHTEYTDLTPYGASAHQVKPGLTRRGKAALGIGAAVIAGGTLVGYQTYSASVADSEAKAQEAAFKMQALELEKIREMNRANEADRQAATSQETARQASIDQCVKNNSSKIGQGYGSPSYRDVADDCRAQYNPTGTTVGMQAAAADTTTTPAQNTGGGISDGALIGVTALVLLGAAVVKKNTRSNPTA
ncbi:hypothetical protein ACIOEX_01480 [Streptomyces sp. NPDC087850]|uniref:hypothetical protein n=1 Tax=Streptomyces sp. NPDC087850 TaxID=3365809 RepID=UPI003818EABE